MNNIFNIQPEFKTRLKMEKILHFFEYDQNKKTITLDDWQLVKDTCKQVSKWNSKDLQNLKYVFTIVNPLLSFEEKNESVKKLRVAPKFIYSKPTKRLLSLVVNEESIKFLSMKYTSINLEQTLDNTLVCRSLKNYYELLATVNQAYISELKTNSKYHQEQLSKIATSSFEVMGLFYSQEDISKHFNETLNNLFKRYPSTDDLNTYKAHKTHFDKLLYMRYPQLELFINLLENPNGGISEKCTKFIKKLKPENIKEFVQEYVGFHSSRIINHIKASTSFHEAIDLLETLKLYKVMKDHNLTWQVLDDFSEKGYIHSLGPYFSDFTKYKYSDFTKYQDCFSSEQWCLFIKKTNEEINNPEMDRKHIISELKDSFSMIGQSVKNGENLLLKSLHTNYRFQEYNTVAKFHEVCILLFNKLAHKEFDLNLADQYPGVEKFHNQELISGLTFSVPKTNLDLVTWGTRLRICVGGYGDKVLQGNSLVLGVYQEGVIKYCLEIDPINPRIIQFRGFRNDDAPHEAFEGLRIWLSNNKSLFANTLENRKKYSAILVRKKHDDFKSILAQAIISYPSELVEEKMKRVATKIELLLLPENTSLLEKNSIKVISEISHLINLFSRISEIASHPMLSKRFQESNDMYRSRHPDHWGLSYIILNNLEHGIRFFDSILKGNIAENHKHSMFY